MAERQRSLCAEQSVEVRMQDLRPVRRRQHAPIGWPPTLGEPFTQPAHRERAVTRARVPPFHSSSPEPDLMPAAAPDPELPEQLGERLAVGLGLDAPFDL